MLRVLTVLLLLLILRCDAAAESPVAPAKATGESRLLPDESPVPAPQEGGLLSAVFRLIGSLLIIVVLIYATVYVLRALMTQRQGRNNPNSMMAVLEHAYLGPNKELCLVRVLDKVFVVAVNTTEIRLLSEVGGAEALPVDRGKPFSGILAQRVSSALASCRPGEAGGERE